MQVLDSLVEGALQLEDEREANELIGMIVRFLATGEEPKPTTDAQRMALTMIRPVLENSRSRAMAGSKGGSKRASKRASKSTSKPASKTASKRASEEEEEEDKYLGEKESKKEKSRFRAPTPQEVSDYADEKGLALDAESFVDFYASKGWKVGRQPMRDWKAAARNWARRDAERQRASPPNAYGRGAIADEYANL